MIASTPNPDFLHSLIGGWENECVEFKEANDNFSTSDIGKYFSALANEANLRDCPAAWLVFGVDNDSREVIGTTYRTAREREPFAKFTRSSKARNAFSSSKFRPPPVACP